MRQRQLGLRHDRRGYFRGKTTSETTTTQVTAIEEEEDEEDRLVPQPRIIGGTRVSDSDRLGRYSYFALMNGQALCGAVLIGAKWIVTAAHCAYADDDFELGTMSRPSGSMDFLSSLFGGGGSSVGGRTYDYLNGRMHPDYSDGEVEHDIAIFQLQTAVPRSVAVPIQISAQPVTAATTAVTVLGFGDTNPTEAVTTTSESLREVQLSYIAQDVCDAQFGSNWMTGSYIGDGMMCAYTRGKDSCGGDSGGPLIVKGTAANGAQDELVGLVSWGISCADDEYPGVYTRISYYYDWIQETICELATSGTGTGATLDYNSLPEGITCPGPSSSTTSGGNTTNNNNNNPAPAPAPRPPTRVPTPPVAAPVSFPTSSSSSGGGYYYEDDDDDDDDDYYFDDDDDDDGGAYTTEWVSVDEFLVDATTWFCSFFGCRRR